MKKIKSASRAADAAVEDQAEKDRRMDEVWSDKPRLRALVDRGEIAGEGLPAPLFHQLRVLRWKLKRSREERGLSQEAAAKAVGMDGPALSRIEGGQVLQPTLLTLWRLADSLGLELTVGIEPKAQDVAGPVPAGGPKRRRGK